MEVSATAMMMASLYVGDLHPELTDVQLHAAFSEFESLTSVRVCKDRRTGKSLCYGYINFLSAHDANLALETKNHMQISGKVIRLMWSRRDSKTRTNGRGNVFVKNLSDSVDNGKLQEVFQKFGKILSCKVVLSEEGCSKGYGFVQFDTEDSANSAIQMLNGTSFDNKKLYVSLFVRKADRVLPSTESGYSNLYIKNLDHSVTEQFLHEMFSKFGQISSSVISKDESGTSRGFGFVNFYNPDDARRAVEAMNGQQLGSKHLYVGRAQTKVEREQMLCNQFEERRKEQTMKFKCCNVYVKNIDDNVSEDILKNIFSYCGKITSLKLMQDEKGSSRGFGFVCFSTPEEANKAVQSFHCYMLYGKPLYVAIAQKKEERLALLQMQFAQPFTGMVAPSAAVMSGAYPPLYYTAPPGVVYTPYTPRPQFMYQPPMGLRPESMAIGAGTQPGLAFQPHHVPMMGNYPQQHQQFRGRKNGHHGGHTQREFSNQKRTGHLVYVPSGRLQGPSSNGRVAPENEANLSSLLAAASPARQKQILSEHLFPLVKASQPGLAKKIIGMLLEMDNSEILLLLESSESLAAKVEEAVHLLNKAKNRGSSGENSIHPFLSAKVSATWIRRGLMEGGR